MISTYFRMHACTELEIFDCDSCVGKAPVITKYQDYYGHS
jgi:hypothetical protein